MENRLIRFFEKYLALTEEEKEAIVSFIPIKKVKKDEFLLKENEVSTSFFFLLEGCVRMFYSANTEEKTAFFYLENSFISSYESFTKQVPSKHNLQAIEPSELAIISFEASNQLLQLSLKFESLARIIMEEELIIYQEIISSFVTLNAEQRYLKLVKENRALLQRIPQHYLATYLGVTPETLSRIRKRVIEKKLS